MSANTSVDSFSLNRFVEAQEGIYERALSELRAVQKRSHWMWIDNQQSSTSTNPDPQSSTLNFARGVRPPPGAQ